MKSKLGDNNRYEGRPTYYKPWFYEVCTGIVDTFGEVNIKQVKQYFAKRSAVELRDFLFFYFDKPTFEQASFKLVKEILSQNRMQVDWDMVSKGMVSNFHFVKFLYDKKELLPFIKFLIECGEISDSLRFSTQFSLCRSS